MGGDNDEVINCLEDDEYRVYCIICDKLWFEKYHKNHLKSRTHIKNVHFKEFKLMKYGSSLSSMWYIYYSKSDWV